MTLNNLYVEALSKSQSSKRRQMGSREESEPRTALAGTHLVSMQRDPRRWTYDGTGTFMLPWEVEEVEPGDPALQANTSPSPFPGIAPHHMLSTILV